VVASSKRIPQEFAFQLKLSGGWTSTRREGRGERDGLRHMLNLNVEMANTGLM